MIDGNTLFCYISFRLYISYIHYTANKLVNITGIYKTMPKLHSNTDTGEQHTIFLGLQSENNSILGTWSIIFVLEAY